LCENQIMSATIVRERRQVTLPAEVCEPAGIEVGDQIDWRLEGDEIRGRKLAPVVSRRSSAKLVKDPRTGLVYFDTPISDEELEAAALNANLDRGQ
jgi:bifunctional DNA-binding transcriptional regulator/antitoxin component of YhaV-PrlF toxin-antitoxin module